jgi:K+-transporting ATPase KdpF subunit
MTLMLGVCCVSALLLFVYLLVAIVRPERF